MLLFATARQQTLPRKLWFPPKSGSVLLRSSPSQPSLLSGHTFPPIIDLHKQTYSFEPVIYIPSRPPAWSSSVCSSLSLACKATILISKGITMLWRNTPGHGVTARPLPAQTTTPCTIPTQNHTKRSLVLMVCSSRPRHVSISSLCRGSQRCFDFADAERRWYSEATHECIYDIRSRASAAGCRTKPIDAHR